MRAGVSVHRNGVSRIGTAIKPGVGAGVTVALNVTELLATDLSDGPRAFTAMTVYEYIPKAVSVTCIGLADAWAKEPDEDMAR